MKVCIATIYNGSNYGGYLQAIALKQVLEEQSIIVNHLNNGARNPRKEGLKAIIRKVHKGDKNGYIYQIKKAKMFMDLESKFIAIKKPTNVDCFVLGSDEIWNVTRKNMTNFPSFFGIPMVNESKVISYAPSINIATNQDFERFPNLVEGLKKLDYISVRDLHSKKVIEEVTGRDDIVEVIDPTMLLTKDDYKKIMKKNTKKNYICLYSYGVTLTHEQKTEIIRYAKNNDLKIISLLEYFDWCDENPICTPEQLLGYFANATTIFTDTFHGTVFSIILNKQFVLNSINSLKVKTLIEKFYIDNRSITSKSIDEILYEKIDYTKVNSILDEYRKESLKFLFSSLGVK